ncbi:MAG: glycosyltransferase family 2 protein [Sphingomonadaceae bacterium]|nr:glycosyltransferase family 2 protein [Sphingomonadaceae bacterium]
MADRDAELLPVAAPPAPVRPVVGRGRGPDPQRLGVVIVNFRQSDATVECLESLLRIPGGFRVVVVDNGSADGSVERLRAWARGDQPPPVVSGPLARLSQPPVPKPLALAEPAAGEVGQGPVPRLSLIASPKNLGFAGGNNLATRFLLGDPAVDRIWYLNNDTVVEPTAVDQVLRTFETDPRIGMVGTQVRFYHAPRRLQALNGMTFRRLTGDGVPIHGGRSVSEPFDPKQVVDRTSFVLGASLAVSRAFLQTVGLMSERYFLYYEEMDWAARNRGRFRIGFARGAIVYHKHGGSIGSSSVRGGRSALAEHYMLKSRLRYYLAHDPLLLPIVWTRGWLQTGVRLARGQPAKAVAMLRALFFRPWRD